MFEVENKYGVKSSFYFRNSTYEPELMKRIESYGSEASLHFESIAGFIKANPEIKNREELFKVDFKDNCLNILKADRDRFRLLCDLPCIIIASHGERELIDKVTSYISDVPIEINNRYRYGKTPLDAIKNEERFIIFLSHPNHWHYNKIKQFKKLVKLITKKPIDKEESFKRI